MRDHKSGHANVAAMFSIDMVSKIAVRQNSKKTFHVMITPLFVTWFGENISIEGS